MSVELFKVRVSQNLKHFQWMHLGRRPVTRRVAGQCECKGAPAWVNKVHTIGQMWPNPLQSRHIERSGVSNHQPHDCLLNRLFRHSSKKTSKLRVTGLCEGTSPVTGEFPTQRPSNAENVSIWWRDHAFCFNHTNWRQCYHQNRKHYSKYFGVEFAIEFAKYKHISWMEKILIS